MRLFTLTEDQYEHCISVGRRRQRINEQLGSTDLKVMDAASVSLHINGALGEGFACLWIGVDPVLTVLANPKPGGTDIAHNGITWNVKRTTRQGYQFIIPESQVFAEDYGILVWPTAVERTGIIVGAASRETYERHRTWGWHLPQPGWILRHAWFTIQSPCDVTSTT